MMIELPDTSRFVKAIRKDGFSIDQHQRADLTDLLAQLLYQTSIVAAGTVGKGYGKLAKKAPKPFDRPVFKEKVKRVFTKPQDLNGIMTRKKAVWIHTDICREQGMHAGEEIPVCGCPMEEVK